MIDSMMVVREADERVDQMVTPPHDPFFVAITANEFRRDHIADLAAGRVAAVRVPELLPRAICEETLKALSKVDFEAYGRQRVYPPVMRFGIGVSDHRQNGRIAESYWAALEEARKAWAALSLAFDPFELCRHAIGKDWPGGIAVGTNLGREMGSGVAREPNHGFQVHFDDASREFEGNLLDANLISQFAFNLYLSVPETGGETVVWRHRWSPSDEAFRAPGTYSMTEEVVGEAEKFELRPTVGEGLLFDPRNFHAVRPSVGSRRIALGMSIGLSDTAQLLTWG